jgi:dTDP-glucose pyrophosphorylase
VLESDGRVLALHEKPEDPPSVWMCPPFYALGRSALERVAPYLASGAPADEIGRLIAHLARHETVHAVRTEGERLDIGSPDSYHRADEILRREPAVLS